MSNEKVTDESIKKVFQGLSASFNKDQIELYEKLYADKKPEIKDPERFYFDFIWPHQKFLNGMIMKELGKENGDIEFLLINYGFVEKHFKSHIEKQEGMSCCADKSRTIMRRLFDFFTTGKEIEFDYAGEYTYHLPATMFKTHADIVEFFTALKQLHYGNFSLYVMQLKKIYNL